MYALKRGNVLRLSNHIVNWNSVKFNSKRGYDPGLITHLKRILLNTNFNPKLCAINIFCDVIVTSWLCWLSKRTTILNFYYILMQYICLSFVLVLRGKYFSFSFIGWLVRDGGASVGSQTVRPSMTGQSC